MWCKSWAQHHSSCIRVNPSLSRAMDLTLAKVTFRWHICLYPTPWNLHLADLPQYLTISHEPKWRGSFAVELFQVSRTICPLPWKNWTTKQTAVWFKLTSQAFPPFISVWRTSRKRNFWYGECLLHLGLICFLWDLCWPLGWKTPCVDALRNLRCPDPSQALQSDRMQGTGSSQLFWLQGCLAWHESLQEWEIQRKQWSHRIKMTRKKFKDSKTKTNARNEMRPWGSLVNSCGKVEHHSRLRIPRLSDHQTLVVDLGLGHTNSLSKFLPIAWIFCIYIYLDISLSLYIHSIYYPLSICYIVLYISYHEQKGWLQICPPSCVHSIHWAQDRSAGSATKLGLLHDAPHTCLGR